jgi:F0F1-type ATP synthase membrane subunit b/b'
VNNILCPKEDTAVKRNTLHISLFLIVIICLALISGCAKPPTDEVETATRTIAEAKLKEADLYVEDVYKKAQDALQRAHDLIADKEYNEAKAAALEATRLAKQALSMVETNKAKMREDTEQMLETIKPSIDEVKVLAAKAFKKKVPINREDIQGFIGKWEIDFITIKEHFNEQSIRHSYDQLVIMQKQIKNQKENITALLNQKET